MSCDPEAMHRVPRWYFGGLSGACAACFTHPIDSIKVLLQSNKDEKTKPFTRLKTILKREGVFVLYRGISASIIFQLTFSTTRFGLYEIGKEYIDTSSMLSKVCLAAVSGACGGLTGNPMDLVNIRMQHDASLTKDLKRNYMCASHGVRMIYRKGGIRQLFTGTMASMVRGSLITVGQIAFYEQIKQMLLERDFEDNLQTHLISAVGAGLAATTLTQPIDLLKTKAMSVKASEYKGLLPIFYETLKKGPLAFVPGFLPSLFRQGPQAVLIFLFLEELRQNFGYLPQRKN